MKRQAHERRFAHRERAPELAALESAASRCEQMSRDVVIFESNVFSLNATKNERGLLSDLPLGLDLAAMLRERFQAARADWSVSEPIAEDFGTVVALNAPGTTVTMYVVVRWIPDRGTNNCWAVQFQQAEGCLRTLLRWLLGGEMDPATLRQAKDLVSRMISDDPERFLRPTWLTEAEFRRRLSSKR